MARGELLRKLFLSHNRGQDEDFRSVALEIIAEEEKKKNYQLAKSLLRILENSDSVPTFSKSPNNFGSLPKDRERQTLLVDVRHPEKRFEDILLQPDVHESLRNILDEYRKSEILRTHGLTPKRKLLFCGPPGCGKTLCTEVISGETGLPLLYTRFDAIVSSYLGETSSNLRKVFDYAADGRWIVLFDEFDAIGKARDDSYEHGEIKRVVNSFLQLLDGFNAPSLVIAATNHEHMLDPALWRRFDEIIYFPKPSIHDTRKLLAMKLKNFPHHELDLKMLASRMKGMSHSDIERICFDAIKNCIINDKDHLKQSIMETALERQNSRLHVTRRASRGKTS